MVARIGSLALFALGAQFTVVASSAADFGFYLDAQFGLSKFDGTLGGSSARFIAANGVTSMDDSDTAHLLSVGYRVTPNFGVELGYADFGRVESATHGSVTGLFFPLNLPFDVTYEREGTARGGMVTLIGSIPIRNWDLALKIGGLRVQSHTLVILKAQSTGGTFPRTTTVADEWETTTEIVAGTHVGYTLAKRYHLGVGWTRVSNLGYERTVGESDVDLLTASFQYRL
jgi:hypothetical protein